MYSIFTIAVEKRKMYGNDNRCLSYMINLTKKSIFFLNYACWWNRGIPNFVDKRTQICVKPANSHYISALVIYTDSHRVKFQHSAYTCFMDLFLITENSRIR